MNWYDRTQADARLSSPFPEKAPRFGRFLPGTNGEMWIELFREDPSAASSYLILAAAHERRRA
jgi:hypothetical protein